MLKLINKTSLKAASAVYIGMTFGAQDAHAGGGNDFSQIAQNLITSIQDLPSLLTGLSYLMGIVLGVLGILKIKDHVEDPKSAPLEQGAIRLAAGGALFALPIVFEAMQTTVGDGNAPVTPTIKQVEFN